MTVTIREVAAEAGTSLSTVSRVFSNPDAVNATTRGRVLKTASRLGYQPNAAARSLRGGRTGSLGLIIPDIANPFFPPVMKAIQGKARRLGYTVLVADSNERPNEEFEAIEALRPRVDGLILWASTLQEEKIIELAARIPIILVNREVAGIPQVQISLSAGVRQAVEHLKAYGHESCAFITCSQPGSNREVSIRRELEEAGIRVVEFGPYEARFETGLHAAPLVLADGATAVIAHNDLVALGLLQQFAALGIRVPEDVSVIGIDDTILAATSSPGLATVRIDPNDIAEAASDLLLGIIGRTAQVSPAEVITVGTRLVPRASSGPVRVNEPAKQLISKEK
ncbi:LacI family DNA-binding transcriptional regulator [Luethyella okanaganae]|uniref:LacI family DNA-binding transcriptional regulator n=1 Tax=Luethyella okanaganae TaxID=69372 RepID=A0ABW1VCB6_9MICO